MDRDIGLSTRRRRATLRPATDVDIDAILRLFQDQDERWWGQVETERDELDQHLALVRRAAGSLRDGSRIAEVDGEMVGFAAVVGHGKSIYALATDEASVRSALFDWLFAAGAREVEVPSHDAELRAEADRRGLEHDASSFELERSAPLDEPPHVIVPDGVEIESWDERFADGVYAAIYSVWGDVPGHVVRGYDEWRELVVDYDSFRPQINLVAHREGQVVGAAMCRYYPGPFGWVSQLAVRRDLQGRGLGRAVLVTALQRLAAGDDVTGVGLGVEAANESALGLYRSVGLQITREWRHYVDPRAAAQGER